MVEEVYASGETVEIAKQKACKLLGADEENVSFEVTQNPSKKVLGVFGGNPAQVRGVLKKSVGAKAEKILKELLFYMGLENLSVEIVSETEDLCEIKVTGDDSIGYIVGKHGETLDSLQYIISLIVNNRCGKNDFCRIRIEAGNYREKRKETLEALANKMAKKAVFTGRTISLNPMKSYERKIIHSAVDKVDGACSWSEGEGAERHIVISPQGTK